MTRNRQGREGQPVLFLGLLLAGWCLIRVLTWQNPWPGPLPLPETLRFVGGSLPDASSSPSLKGGGGATVQTERAVHPYPVYLQRGPVPAVLIPQNAAQSNDPAALFDTHRRALGHNLLFAAGMANLPMPRSVADMLERETTSPRLSDNAGAPPGPSRWRFDGWIVLRQGGTQLSSSGERPASYGASQLGAVLAYRLAPANARSPETYVRVSQALVDRGEAEGALGLRVRPIAAIPLSLHAEARFTRRAGGADEIRPAAFLSGGFDALRLPARVSLRGYGQAGYVGGDFDTAFADGALVAERRVAQFDLGEVSLGAGVRGGAQRGAARLDIGPSVSVRLDLGAVPARVEADYRWRVAGQAAPGNGGVLTLSTGF